MPKTKKQPIDWEAIEEEYRAGQLSLVAIARHYNTTHQAISIRAKRKNWVRDLTGKVQSRIKQKLVADAVAENVANRNATEEEIKELAAERGANVIRTHRKDINLLRAIEITLLDELINNPTKLYLTQYQGEIIEKKVDLTVAEKAMAANNLANVQHKRIALERKAFNLDEAEQPDDDLKSNLTDDDKHLIRKAARIISQRVIEREIMEREG